MIGKKINGEWNIYLCNTMRYYKEDENGVACLLIKFNPFIVLEACGHWQTFIK